MTAPVTVNLDNAGAWTRVEALKALYDGDRVCLAELLCDRYDPDSLAYRIIDTDLRPRDLTYGELRAESERFAAALANLGVTRGDRVATLMGKSRAYLVCLMAIWRLGAVHVPLFTAFGAAAVAMRLSGSQAKVVACDPGQEDKLRAARAEGPSEWQVVTTGEGGSGALGFQALLEGQQPGLAAACVDGAAPFIHIYTSGTTGQPKGVIVPVRALAAFRAYAEFGHGVRPDDVFWCAADPGWAYGLYFGVLATFSTGVPSLLLEGGFAPEKTLAVLADQGVTNFAAAPTVYRALLTSGLAVAEGLRLRAASSAGEPLTPDVNAWAREALGVEVHDHYGQTEAGMLINNHHLGALQRPVKPGSMGLPMPGWTAAVLAADSDRALGPLEVGRVAMRLDRSPLAWFGGYDGNPAKSAEKFTADGQWYLTGDTGHFDDDGYFFFSARDDDVIIMAGYRIGPFEVESVLATHDKVAESAVIATPDPVRGEVVEAFVVLMPGETGSPELAMELQQWVKTRYAAHAYPRAIHFADALPKTPGGKVQRYVLKDQRRRELAEGPGGA